MELKLIERTSQAAGRLNAALKIYRETILPEAQNPERQILYWIDHSQDDLADEFRCFALCEGRAVVGYLQYTFFKEERILFFEYLCVKSRIRKGLVPSAALTSIEEFLANQYGPGFTIVFEIARLLHGGNWVPDSRLLRYFTRLGFRTVEFNYQYPVLQSYDGAISYPADLMVRLPDNRTLMSTSEIRTVLRCLYFRHYLRWDRPFLTPAQYTERERLIDRLYSQEVTSLDDSDRPLPTRGDPARARLMRFDAGFARTGAMLQGIFGRRLPRVVAVIGTVLAVERVLGSVWLLIPFVPVVAALYCLADNTDASRKLLKMVFAKFSVVRPRT